MKLRFYTLWAINAALDERRLCAQLDQMRDFGFDGAVFHPRFYPGQPPYLGDEYMAILSRTILHAKSLGMDFWIYDEDGWPSGTVSGQLLRAHPEDGQHWADLVTEVDGSEELGRFEHDGQLWHVVRRSGPGVDYLNSNLANHFLQMTHERYRTGLTRAAFEYVSTFFSDEPEFGLGHAFDALSKNGSIPWTPKLPELYKKRFGRLLADVLPSLFFNVGDYRQARINFWELLTDIFCEGFIAPMDEWCRSHGKRLAAHVKGEEHPLFQVPTHGSAQQIFRRLSMPAIDALERDPSNDFFPRQLTSTARQFGDGRSMVECFGGAGWGARPEEFQKYMLWLGGHGITDFVVHLWQYRLNSHAIRDWPASIPNHIGWSPAFSQVLRELKPEMVAAAKASGVDLADWLLVSPHRGVMSEFEPREFLGLNVHNASTYKDSPAARINDRFMATVAELQHGNRHYHLADERTFEDGSVEQCSFRVGHHSYRRVILSTDCVLTAKGESIVNALQQLGILIHDLERAPEPARIPILREPSATLPTTWAITTPPNAMPLEPSEAGAANQFIAGFICDEANVDLEVRFADDVINVQFNRHFLVTRQIENGTVAQLPKSLLHVGENRLQFQSDSRPGDSQSRPFAWLVGNFFLHSRSIIPGGPNGTVVLNGPYTVCSPPKEIGRDLTSSGFPFVGEPVVATTAIDLPRGTSIICFGEIAADAARVEIDGNEIGYAWGPIWQILLTKNIEAGPHALSLTLYPSAFTRYGPHHHVDGDKHVVSPIQFVGRKNFADRLDAPERTDISAWHVKPLSFPSAIVCARAH